MLQRRVNNLCLRGLLLLMESSLYAYEVWEMSQLRANVWSERFIAMAGEFLACLRSSRDITGTSDRVDENCYLIARPS